MNFWQQGMMLCVGDFVLVVVLSQLHNFLLSTFLCISLSTIHVKMPRTRSSGHTEENEKESPVEKKSKKTNVSKAKAPNKKVVSLKKSEVSQKPTGEENEMDGTRRLKKPLNAVEIQLNGEKHLADLITLTKVIMLKMVTVM